MEECYLESVGKKYFSILILLLLISLSVFSQDYDEKYWRRIPKKEFKLLKNNKLKFFPKNINNEKVIIERLNIRELLELERKAFYASYYRNGIDTTTNKPKISNYESNEDSVKYINKRYKDLEGVSDEQYVKKYINYFDNVIVTTKDDIKIYSKDEYRYVVRWFFYTNKKNPKHLSWTMTLMEYIHDRKTDKSYDVFMPMNYTLFDLMKD